MKLYELFEKVDELTDILALRNNRVLIRVDGRMYDIEEFNLGIYGNKSIVIIDITPEKK